MDKVQEKLDKILNIFNDNGFDRNSTEGILDNFLNHKSKKVLLLKGKWGVGKTHFWNDYISRKISNNEIIEKRYSYVSLFGAEDIKDVEELIIAGSINPQANEVRRSTENLSKEIQDLVADIPKLKEWSGIINRVCRIAIDDTLICIDDLERKDKSLSLSILFGLVSVFKELKNCRIVIIFNEESLAIEDKEDLELYREKIVDQELTFAPTIKDNFNLIWGIKDNASSYLPLFTKVKVNNIRVMQQTQWSIDYFLEILKNSSVIIQSGLKQSILKQVCFLTIFYYQKDLAIDISKLKKYYSTHFRGRLIGGDKQSKEFKEIEPKISKLAQWGVEEKEYDGLIINYLQHGKCDQGSMNLILKRENKRFIESDFYREKGKAWDFYWSNFQITSQQVTKNFSDFINKNINNLNWKDLTDIVEIIRQLDKEKEYEKDIETWISTVEKNYLDLTDDEIRTLLEDSFLNISDDLREKLSDKVKTNGKKKKIISIISDIVETQKWNLETFELLNIKEISDYKEEFLNSNEDDFLDVLASFYNMFVGVSNNNEIESVVKKIEQALYAIGNESCLNKMRIAIRFPKVFEKGNNNGK